MVVMKKFKKQYLVPIASQRWLSRLPFFCTSGGAKFMDADGFKGNLKAVESDADAAEAVSRRFDDEEYEE